MTRYIAIDGKGGSGKTYLSSLLAERLGATLLHLDDYGDDYKPFIGLPRLVAELEQITDDIVIYEGVGVFDERFDKFKPFRILVQVPGEIKAARASSRDVPRADRSAEDWKKIWDIWFEAEAKYFDESFSQKADIIVGTEDGQFDIELILARLDG